MIYALHYDLKGMLDELKFPIHWLYGPTPVTVDGYPALTVVVERNRDGQSDAIRAPQGAHPNARQSRVRELPAKITIYARETAVAGAHIGDHETLCEKVVDALIVALAEWGTAAKVGTIAITEARYLRADERADVEKWPGVVYVLRFTVPRGVRRRDFLGNARPTGTVTGVGNRTDVRPQADPDADPATGCESA